jgi:hypothetical protein
METRPQPEEHEAHLGLGWSASLEARRGGALLRVSHPEQRGLLLEIAITVDGPVVRARCRLVVLAGEIRRDVSASQLGEPADRFKARDTQQASGTSAPRGAVEVDATAGDA